MRMGCVDGKGQPGRTLKREKSPPLSLSLSLLTDLEHVVPLLDADFVRAGAGLGGDQLFQVADGVVLAVCVWRRQKMTMRRKEVEREVGEETVRRESGRPVVAPPFPHSLALDPDFLAQAVVEDDLNHGGRGARVWCVGAGGARAPPERETTDSGD